MDSDCPYQAKCVAQPLLASGLWQEPIAFHLFQLMVATLWDLSNKGWWTMKNDKQTNQRMGAFFSFVVLFALIDWWSSVWSLGFNVVFDEEISWAENRVDILFHCSWNVTQHLFPKLNCFWLLSQLKILSNKQVCVLMKDAPNLICHSQRHFNPISTFIWQHWKAVTSRL